MATDDDLEELHKDNARRKRIQNWGWWFLIICETVVTGAVCWWSDHAAWHWLFGE